MKKFNFSKGMIIGLLTLALCLTCFGYVKASAEEAETPTVPAPVTATFDADKNELTAEAEAVVYVLKKEKGNVIKAGSTSYGTTSKKITVEDLGIKSTTKDVYLYICDKEFESDGKSINANFIIKAQAAKKVVATINYAKADTADATDVLSIVATDAKKKEIEEPAAIWAEEIDGAYAAAATFKGSVLKAMLDEDGGTIFVKMQGVSGASGTAQFASKALKVKIAKPANAPKVKIDYVKGTVAIKNGFDYCVLAAKGTPDTWKTILPFNKLGKAEDSTIDTADFAPAAKPDTAEHKAMFTKEKIAAVEVDELLGHNAEIYLYVRKSATAKKPASKYNDDDIKIVKRDDAPEFAEVKGETSDKKVTTFVSSLSDCEFLILAPGTDPETADLSGAKWVKLTDKGIILKKTATKVSKSKSNTLKVDSVVLVRKAAVKGEKLASKYAVTTIEEKTETVEEVVTTTYLWKTKE